jgi:hypothetical protein
MRHMAQDLRLAARIDGDLRLRLRLEAAIRGLSVNQTVAALLNERMRTAGELAALIAREGEMADVSK